jgi:aminoglycoside phosphotransferase (APT) family kinase protein
MAADRPGPDSAFRDTVARLLERPVATLSFTPLSGGVSSDIWRVDTPDGHYCAKRALPRLRVAALWEAPVARNAEEVRWLNTTRAWVGDQVARVVAHDEAAGIAVLAWYDPASWRNWKAELLAGRVEPACGTRLGHLLGTVIRASIATPGLDQAFANHHLFDALRIDPFFRHVCHRHPPVTAVVELLESDGRALVHGDFSPKNVLVSDANEIRVLDAECATWGCPAFDAGYMLAHLLLKHLHTGNGRLLVTARSFWHAFRSAVGETLGDLDSPARRVLGGMLLARVDGKSPVEYLSDGERNRARQRGLCLLEEPSAAATMTTLLEHWDGDT